jgi:hypothetical protein
MIYLALRSGLPLNNPQNNELKFCENMKLRDYLNVANGANHYHQRIKNKIKILHNLVETLNPSTRPNPFSHYLNDVLHPKYNV